MQKILEIKKLLTNNLKVIENYFFMTIIQVIGSLIGIIIYPYLIRSLGSESYGLYIFALSIVSYFLKIVSFGFSLPAIKAISQNVDNKEFNSKVVSSVISAKAYLSIISTIVFFVSIYFIPFLNQNILIYCICFTQIISEVFFPFWYYQAMQKMRIIAFLQLGIRILSLPFIFIFVKFTNDIFIYAIIGTLSNIIVAMLSIVHLTKKENIKICFVPIKQLKTYFKDALPFFWSSSASTIKTESITTIIGIYFSMVDVAQWDLANKILQLPRIIASSINEAIFPKMIKDTKKSVVKQIIKYEFFLGLGIFIIIAITGHWLVLLLGGEAMSGAYPLTVIFSLTILQGLIIGCYYSFVFIPNYKYYFITKNQVLSFFSFFVLCISGILLFNNIFIVVAALVLSGTCEIAYCNYLIKKYKLA